MNSALYSAYLGMRARQQRLDVIANNIANASTAGFKGQRLLYRSVEAAEKEANQTASNPTNVNDTTTATTVNGNGRDLGVLTSERTDFSPGPIRETGRTLDVALNGDGFLVVQTARGERYTRQGSLTLDNSGQLVTHNGDLVIGTGGPITVPRGEVNIGDDGTITVGGRSAGQLKLVHFPDPSAVLSREGNSLFAASGSDQAVEATDTHVVQGSLEMSNVNSLTEMVAMMQNTREFESLQHSVSTLMNDLGRKVATEIGRL